MQRDSGIMRKQLPPSFTPTPSSSSYSLPAINTPLTSAQIDAALQKCLDLQTAGVTLHSKRPFAALLLGPDKTTVLLSHLSISHVQHAEAELARLASIHYSQPYLWDCTLISTWEPCAMCTGTIYWANIGRLIYAASEEELNKLTGQGNGENMTMSLPCRDVLTRGQKVIDVIGPVKGWAEKVIRESGKWWREHSIKEEQGEKGNKNAVGLILAQDLDRDYAADLQSSIDWLS